MKFAFPPPLRAVGLGLLLAGAAAGAAMAQDAALAKDAVAAAPTPQKGDVAWMLTSAALVLFMSVPGLALFYGGLVRSKNMVSVLSQVFAIVALVAVIWVVYGYSFAFTEGGGGSVPVLGATWNAFIGGFDRLFLKGVDANSTVGTFSNGVVIPELVFIAFQMTFACITPALIIGSFAERIKFSSLLVFTFLWVTFIYFPMAHAVWYWAGPDAVAEAAKALAAATTDAAKAEAQAHLDAVNSNAGYLFQLGALDFAGGTVVHINAGIAGLVGAIVIGKRIGFPREVGPPHSVTMSMIGAAILWVGWFGFNAGSALEATGATALAFVNTFVATAAATLSWAFVEWAVRGKPSLLGIISGAVAGLVAITPAAGFGGPMGSIVLGFVAGAICFFFVDYVKKWFGYDDSLDVFGVHCVGGIVGAIATGVLVAPSLGGAGLVDYSLVPGTAAPAEYVMGAQVLKQIKAVAFTLIFSGVGSFILYKIVDLIFGLRVSKESEMEGLDITSHGERAYNL